MADPPEDENDTSPERAIQTTILQAAVLGALQIVVPTGEEVERTISQAIVDLINRNRPRVESEIFPLPKLGTILARMNVSTQWAYSIPRPCLYFKGLCSVFHRSSAPFLRALL